MQNDVKHPQALAAWTRVHRPAAALCVPAVMLARGHGLTPLSSKEGSAGSPWYLGVPVVSRQSCGRYPGLNFARENDVGGLRPGRLRKCARLGGCELRSGHWGRIQGLTRSGTVTITWLRAACYSNALGSSRGVTASSSLHHAACEMLRISSTTTVSSLQKEASRSERAGPCPKVPTSERYRCKMLRVG